MHESLPDESPTQAPHQTDRAGATRTLAVFAVALAFALLMPVAACGKKKSETGDGAQPAPAAAHDCTAVGDKLAQLTTGQVQRGIDDNQRKLVLAQLPLIKEKTIHTCRQDDWSSEVRACMIQAADGAAFNQCTAALRKARGLPPPLPTPLRPATKPDSEL